MAYVDALSRVIVSIEVLLLEKVLQYKQLADPAIRAIADALENEEYDKFFLIES